MSLAGPKAPSCSFCGKNKNEVKLLIAGPEVFICDECVSLCSDIVAEEVGGTDGKLERIAGELSVVGALLDGMPQTKGLRAEADVLARAVAALAKTGVPS